jgi:hypothetical protein
MDHYAPYGADAIVLGNRQLYSFDQQLARLAGFFHSSQSPLLSAHHEMTQN